MRSLDHTSPRFRRVAPVFLGLAVLTAPSLRAQEAAQQAAASATPNISLEQIFASGDFRGERFGPARWIDDGAGYTTLERSEGGLRGADIVRYDTQSGERAILVSANRLVPSGATDPLSIHNYSWSDDGRKLLVFTNSQRVWRQNTRGDYWVLDLDSWELTQLGGDAEPSTLMFAKFSPDASRAAYVVANNIYVERLADGRVTQLTDDGSTTIINGTFDWVHEEEFFLRDGFRWSPDGRSIAFWQLDAEGVQDFLLINYTDSLYSYVTPIQYPKAGTTNSSSRIGVVSAEGGATRWFELSDDPRNNYIARMEWADSPDELVVQHLNRNQNVLDLLMLDVKSGDVRTILTERDDAWLDVIDDLNWLDGGKRFTWISERDGWRHVYLVSRSGDEETLVTDGDYDVVSVSRVDTEGGWLYFIAAPDDPTQRYLYRTRLDGSGKLERLTPEDEEGWNSYDVAPDAGWAFHRYSTFDTPTTIDLVDLPRHDVVRVLAASEALHEKIAALGRAPTEFFQVDADDGVALDGWVMKPRDFDFSMQYPVLFYVYGEPWGQTVVDRWGGSRYLWHHYLTELGYVVMSIDNRGTPAPRGHEWRKSVYKQIGVLASADQAAAVRDIAAWSYVDPTRIGIWGWSGGGSMTLNALFRYPELYAAGMSVAPVPDMKYYDTAYQERYMGLPQDDPEAYRQGSPITFASQLEGELLIVHGTGDDNVHYQGTEALINELVKHNKQFTMMAYPNRTHGIWEGEGTTMHLYTMLTNFLLENLPAGPAIR